MKKSGAISCKQCNALFVPASNKSWTENGFCSASCAKQQGETVSNEELFVQRSQSKVSNIEVTCSSSHAFEVMASFPVAFDRVRPVVRNAKFLRRWTKAERPNTKHS